jgi:hypothetical protein
MVMTLLIWLVYTECAYFFSKKETNAKVLTINQPSDFLVTLKYFNKYLNQDVQTSIKVNSSYKSVLPQVGDSVIIKYGKRTPNEVYIKKIIDPKPFKLIIPIFALILLFFLAQQNFQKLLLDSFPHEPKTKKDKDV